MLNWLRRFRDCWKLARQIQRGELIAIRPGLLSAALGGWPVQTTTTTGGTVAITIEARPPEAVEVAEDDPPPDPSKQWQVRLVRGDIVKVLASFADPREAMRWWNAYTRNRPGGILELYDSVSDVVRGTR